MSERCVAGRCVGWLLVVAGAAVLAGEAPEAASHVPLAMTEAARRVAVVEVVSGADATSRAVAAGVFVGAEGDVITSIAAVAGAKKIYVRRLHSRRHRARLGAVDQTLGLALLQSSIGAEPLAAPASEPVEVGEWVLVAYPVAGGGEEHALGIVPAAVSSVDARIDLFGRPCESLIQLNAMAPRGTAAAPVVNIQGRMVGLLLAVRGCLAASACSYVLPVERVVELAETLGRGESRRLGWMGVALKSVSDRGEGVEIAAVMQGCAAHRNGLKPGDIIRSVDEHETNDPAALQFHIGGAGPGRTVALLIERDGILSEVSLTLDARPLMISTTCPGTRP